MLSLNTFINFRDLAEKILNFWSIQKTAINSGLNSTESTVVSANLKRSVSEIKSNQSGRSKVSGSHTSGSPLAKDTA